MRAPVFLMASGVRSSGSTLMPPVQNTISQPASSIRWTSAVMASVSSPGVAVQRHSQPNAASLACRMGVNLSSIRPFFTSLPVATMPNFLRFSGKRRRMGVSPASALACSIFSFLMTSGMTRVPHSLSPFFTTNPLDRVAIISSPMAFSARSRGRSTRNSPSASAVSSILPSLASPARMCSFRQMSRRISAASFSWSMVSSFSQT